MDNPEEESQPVESFPTLARAQYDLFTDGDDIKFVRLARSEVQRLASDSGKKIPEGLDFEDLIFVGPQAQDHWHILTENFGLTREEAGEILYLDAGLIFKIPGNEAYVVGVSGELQSSEGVTFYQMRNDSQKLFELHSKTASILNEVYKNSEYLCDFKTTI